MFDQPRPVDAATEAARLEPLVVERAERDLAMLERLAEMGMELAEAITARAKARLGAVGDGPLAVGEDPTAPFNRIAQTVRRTLALKTRLAESGKSDRARGVVQRPDEAGARLRSKRAAINRGLRAALAADDPDRERQATECLLMDMDEILDDSEDFKDLANLPVGETLARLCKILGIDADLCVPKAEGWEIRRMPLTPVPDDEADRTPAQGKALETVGTDLQIGTGPPPPDA